LAVLQDLLFAVILIVVVIYRNAPSLKNFREKYNIKALWAASKKKKADKGKKEA